MSTYKVAPEKSLPVPDWWHHPSDKLAIEAEKATRQCQTDLAPTFLPEMRGIGEVAGTIYGAIMSIAAPIESELIELEKEIVACLEKEPLAVRVREGNGPEELAASLAVTMAAMRKENADLAAVNKRLQKTAGSLFAQVLTDAMETFDELEKKFGLQHPEVQEWHILLTRVAEILQTPKK